MKKIVPDMEIKGVVEIQRTSSLPSTSKSSTTSVRDKVKDSLLEEEDDSSVDEGMSQLLVVDFLFRVYNICNLCIHF